MMTPDAACASINGLTQAIVSQSPAYWQGQPQVTLTVNFEYVPDAQAFNVVVQLIEGKPAATAPTFADEVAHRHASDHEQVAA